MVDSVSSSPTQIKAESQATSDSFEKLFGFVPNIFEMMAEIPHALAAFKGPLERTLDAAMRDRIALAVSEVNGSDSFALSTRRVTLPRTMSPSSRCGPFLR